MNTYLPITLLALAACVAPVYASSSLNPDTIDEINHILQQRQASENTDQTKEDTPLAPDKVEPPQTNAAHDDDINDVENSYADNTDEEHLNATDPVAVFLSIGDPEAHQNPEPTPVQRQAHLKQTFDRINRLFESIKKGGAQ